MRIQNICMGYEATLLSLGILSIVPKRSSGGPPFGGLENGPPP